MRVPQRTLWEVLFCKTHCPPPIINTRLIHLPMSTRQGSQSVIVNQSGAAVWRPAQEGS